MIRDQVFPLQAKSSAFKCCRITVQERTVIPQRSETIVATKAMFDSVGSRNSDNLVEYATVPREVADGVCRVGNCAA